MTEVRVKSGSPALSEDDPNKKYCLCQEVYDESRFMIGCESCDGWYHCDCLGISDDEGEALEHFICPICTSNPSKTSETNANTNIDKNSKNSPKNKNNNKNTAKNTKISIKSANGEKGQLVASRNNKNNKENINLNNNNNNNNKLNSQSGLKVVEEDKDGSSDDAQTVEDAKNANENEDEEEEEDTDIIITSNNNKNMNNNNNNNNNSNKKSVTFADTKITNEEKEEKLEKSNNKKGKNSKKKKQKEVASGEGESVSTNNNNSNRNEHEIRGKSVTLEEMAVPDFEPQNDVSTLKYDELTKDTIESIDASQLDLALKYCKKEIDMLEFEVFGLMSVYDQKNGNVDLSDDDDTDTINTNTNTSNNNNKINETSLKNSKLIHCPIHSVPIRADVGKFNFNKLVSWQRKYSVDSRLFDIIMMDPPWQLANSNPTRGVAIGYAQLSDNLIRQLPIPKLQEHGFIFIWVINAKYRLAIQLMHDWGYKIINDIAWVKQTVNRRVANGHGYYLQHAKETCLIGIKGNMQYINKIRGFNVNGDSNNDNNDKDVFLRGVCSDVIYSERRGQSQKPREVYEYAERLVPNGYYLEIFGRRNNLRNGWITIGNEL